MKRIFTRKRESLENDVTVIIRSVHERTEAACAQLLENQISVRNISIIHQRPFSQALKKSFEIGVESGRKWTLVIDADVLPKPQVIRRLYTHAQKAPSSVFVVQTEMLDKFFGGLRVGGIKLYRTNLLEEALEIVPDVDNRPEAFTIKRMHKSGHYVDITKIICGVHDFEQYYSDIFRKGFAHGMKHSEYATILLPYWERMSATDKDFSLLTAGYEIALTHEHSLKLDRDEVEHEYNIFQQKYGLHEKGQFVPPNDKKSFVHEMINDFMSPHEYHAAMVEVEKRGRPTIPQGVK